jgi:hypothetical protein
MALLLGAPVRADDGFRCTTGRLASVGDRLVEVRQRCGEPDFADRRMEQRRQRFKVRKWMGDHWAEVSDERIVDVIIEEWTYDLGPQQFVRYLTFEDGRLTNVNTGDYGQRR